MEESPADASTLIYIAKADAFHDLAWRVPRLLVPRGVWREAVVEGERVGATEVPRIHAAEAAELIVRVELSEPMQAQAATIAAQNRLGVGESEVLAIGRGLGHAIIDEGRGSRVARALGLVPYSTLFLPILGRRSGGLSAPRAVTLFRRLAAVTGARSDVVQSIERALRKEYR